MKKIKKQKVDPKKPLVLDTQTIRQLTDLDLVKAAGGGPWTGSRCWCN
jgi:hypothetical protein